MYTPNPNSNIGQLYGIIPNNKALTANELYQIISNIHPAFRKKSVNTHLRFLEKKGLVFSQQLDGLNYFSRKKSSLDAIRESESGSSISKVTSAKKNLSLGGRVLEYCKQKVGKRISSREVKKALNAQNNGYLDILKRLSDSNAIQLIEHTSPHEYLVLPDIKALEKVPTKKDLGITKTPSVILKHEPIQVDIKNNLANMSLSDILSEYVVLKQENTRLREALERMGMEFIQLGILEGD